MDPAIRAGSGCPVGLPMRVCRRLCCNRTAVSAIGMKEILTAYLRTKRTEAGSSLAFLQSLASFNASSKRVCFGVRTHCMCC